MRPELDVVGELTIEHGEYRIRLLGRGRRAILEIPNMRAALAFWTAGTARLFRLAPVAAVHAAAGVVIELYVGRARVGFLSPTPRPSIVRRLLGLEGVRLDVAGLFVALLRRRAAVS